MKQSTPLLLVFGSMFVISTCLLATGADNSKVNKRDDNPGQVTAEQQGTSQKDVALTQEIRRSITEDSSLSTYAHNIKIVSRNGQVTIKGPVTSETEKATVEKIAKQVAGADKVKSELAVTR